MKIKLLTICLLLFTSQVSVSDKEYEKPQLLSLEKILISGDVNTFANNAIDSITNESINISKKFLDNYFPTVEITYDAAGGEKPIAGILLVAPITDKKNISNTFFTQFSSFYKDDRTTLNLGLGYRYITDDKKFLYGINAFYDHEFPYDHGRTSIGLEAMSTMWEIRGNKYWASTEWNVGRNGKLERALDGYDMEAGITLPYINWVTLFVKHFNWDAYNGADDLEGQDLSLRAQFPNFLTGLEIEAGKSYYNDYENESFIKISYNLMKIFEEKNTYSEPWVNNNAYNLKSVEHKRFEKVRRENFIVKQMRGNLKVVTR